MTFDQAMLLQIQLVNGWDQLQTWPVDFGGFVKGGITQATYTAWRQYRALPPADVRAATNDQIRLVYEDFFWNNPKVGNALPITEALADPASFTFFSINTLAGEKIAFNLLQQVLLVKPSGAFDEATQAAFLAANHKVLAQGLFNAALGYFTWVLTPQSQPMISTLIDQLTKSRALVL